MRKILIVVGYENLGALCQDELRDQGYEVELAHTGAEAVHKMTKSSPDLIVIDLMGGEWKWASLLGHIKGMKIRPSVIVNTIWSRAEEGRKTLVADAFLTEWPDICELKRKVRDVLEGAPRRPVV